VVDGFFYLRFEHIFWYHVLCHYLLTDEINGKINLVVTHRASSLLMIRFLKQQMN